MKLSSKDRFELGMVAKASNPNFEKAKAEGSPQVQGYLGLQLKSVSTQKQQNPNTNGGHFVLETGSHYITQAGLELTIFLSLLPEC